MRGPNSRIGGVLAFRATHKEWEAVDEFEVEISVPGDFPRTPPTVIETGGRIPRTEDYHINSDNTLCLGSTLALKKSLFDNPSLLGFIDEFVVGFLLNASIKLREGGDFVTGALGHGVPGLLFDYHNRFGLESGDQVVSALELLSLKKRIANKRGCPCLCGHRLGRCRLHNVLNEYRKIAPRSWFAQHCAELRPFASLSNR